MRFQFIDRSWWSVPVGFDKRPSARAERASSQARECSVRDPSPLAVYRPLSAGASQWGSTRGPSVRTERAESQARECSVRDQSSLRNNKTINKGRKRDLSYLIMTKFELQRERGEANIQFKLSKWPVILNDSGLDNE